MRIELVTIGDELLLGQIVNSNIALIGSRLLKIGLQLAAQATVPDELTALEAALRGALDRSDVVITTGGLGPTADDNTKDVLCSIFECQAELDQPVLDDLLKRFGQKLSETIRTQAVVPAKARIIENSVGTAPGFIFDQKPKLMIVLPGPPRELTPMLDKYVLPRLSEMVGNGKVFRQKTFRTTGIGESDVDRRMHQLMKSVTGVGYGLMARPHQVDVRLTCLAESAERADQLLQDIGGLVESEFGDNIFGKGDQKIEAVIGKMLKERNITIALAESCTGGLITSRITDIPGSSDYLNGTIVSYSNQWKHELLDVPEETLKQHGAVSSESARAMAEGVRKISGSDLGLAITGIAGPTGGSAVKPVGLVYMALSDGESTTVKKNNFRGDREMVKFRSSQVALDMIRRYLLSL
jgi:competence/damage-inducible protein CinA-like protein